MVTPEHLHFLLIRHVAAKGHAPDLAQLAVLAGAPVDETERGLRALSDMHGVILVPNSTTVWSVHPFALMPTALWVESKTGGWWANCAWCALAIGAMLRVDVNISTGEGGEGDRIEFRVANGSANRPEVLMHFPYPPARWWDNPYCPCGNILFFTSEAKIDAWCLRHGRPKGSVLRIEAGIRLAERWFGDYASPGWRRKTAAEALAIFRDLDLDDTFWNLSEPFR